jgi:outer membrane protein assembly factor BamD
MPTLSMRFSRLLLIALLALAGTSPLVAQLDWSPETGWVIDENTWAGLSGQDVQGATALMNNARAAEERGNKGKAIRLYKKVFKKYPNSIFSPEALYRQGHLRLSRREYFRGFDSFQTIMSLYPNYAQFEEVLATQYGIAEALMNGARNYYWGWVPSFKSRSRSITYFEWIIANAPYSDYAPLSLMNIARTQKRQNNVPYAIDALDRLINNYAQSLLAPDAYLQLAQTHASLVEGPDYDQESTREAITYFEDFMILFPDDPGLAEAQHGLDQMRTVLAESKMVLGDYLLKYRKNYQGARVFYNEAITSYPNSDVAARARAQLDIIEQRMQEAGLTFDEDGKLTTVPVEETEAAGDVTISGDEPKRKKFLGIF